MIERIKLSHNQVPRKSNGLNDKGINMDHRDSKISQYQEKRYISTQYIISSNQRV